MRIAFILLLSVMLLGCKDKNAAKKEVGSTKKSAGKEVSSKEIAGNEASAVGALRAIASSQAIFLETGPNGEFGTLKELGEKKYIDSVLANGTKQGYKFNVVVGDKDGNSKGFEFSATAEPVETGKTGIRHFYIDHTGIIRVAKDKPANAKSPAVGK